MLDNESLVKRAVMDYMIVEKSALGKSVDIHVAQGSGGRCLPTF